MARTHFAGTTTDVDFSSADLSACTITQDQLDASKSYEATKIPANCLAYWNKQARLNILSGLEIMHTHALQNLDPSNVKRIEIQRLYSKYQPILADFERKITAAEKREMLGELRASKDGILATHRNLRYVFAELISFILSLGIGYIIVAGINKQRTGYFGLFAQPISSQDAARICNSIEEIASNQRILIT